MGDRYLQEHHAYAIAQKACHGGRRKKYELNERHSWVMLTQRGEIVKLPRESILHKPKSRISLEISVPKVLQGRTPFAIESSDGEVYITNQRIIYIPARPTEDFKSFAAPILNFEDSHISSPWFGSWYWFATVKPVSQGGIPPDVARIDVKLSFKDGGHNEFREKFELIKERLHHARELERELGHGDVVSDEPLPAYEAGTYPGGPGGSPTPPLPIVDPGDAATSRRPTPSEPPPGYDEAQAQQVSMRLEDHIRGEAERS